MTSHPRWQVVESKRFEKEKAAISPDAKRMDEVLAGVYAQLENDPDGSKIKDEKVESPVQRVMTSSVWATTTGDYPGAPPLIVYYKIEKTSVTLLSILKAEEDDDET